MSEITLRTLAEHDLPEAGLLLQQLNPDVPLEVLAARLHSLGKNHPHYQIFGAFDGERLIGVAGAWIATKLWCGRYLEIDNLVVDERARSSGVGTLMIRHFEKVAEETSCNILVMDSYSGNHASHRLYHRLGFEIWGFHFVKPINDWKHI